MSFLVGTAKSQASQQSAVSGLQLQSSSYGKVIPLVYPLTPAQQQANTVANSFSVYLPQELARYRQRYNSLFNA